MEQVPQLTTNKSTAHQLTSFHIYRWIISYVRPYWLSLVLLIASGIFVVGIELVIPKLIQAFVDTVLPGKDTILFKQMLIGLCVALAVMFAFMALRNRLERILREKASRDLQSDIFQQLRRLGFSYFERNAVGDSLYLFNTDVSKVQDIYRKYLPDIVWKSLFVLLSIVLMAMIDYRLTLIMLVSFCFYYVLGPFLEKKTMAIVNEGDKLHKQADKRIYDLLSGIGEVRVHGSESWAFTSYAHKTKEIARNGILFWAVWSSRDAFRRFTYYLGAVAVFIIASFMIRNGSLSVGEFIAFVLYYFNGLLMMTNIVTDITEQRALMVNARRLYSFQKLEPDVAESQHPVKLPLVRGELNFEKVSFGYPSRPNVLDNLDLHIRSGERVALVGTSGNGKSTALKLIGRFYDPVSGEVKLDGVSLKRLTFSQLRGALGYVFQETYLYGASIKENIKFGQPEASDERIVEAAKAAYAHDFIMELPQQYDTLVGERGIKLSGGQKQRISIARMLIKNPSILVLDEATSALDQASELEVQKALTNLMHGRTTVTVAHRLSTIMDYDRIIVMDRGTVAEQGTYEELISKRGLLYKLLEGEQTAVPMLEEVSPK